MGTTHLNSSLNSVLRGTAQGKELSGTVFSSARSSLLSIMKLLTVMVVVMAGFVTGMDVGNGGVYDSPMAQDYYVKRFGFMFGGGRSGMYGLKALQADGRVAQKQEVKPAVQMRKPMVELAPKRMGSTYFNTFMAVPRPS